MHKNKINKKWLKWRNKVITDFSRVVDFSNRTQDERERENGSEQWKQFAWFFMCFVGSSFNTRTSVIVMHEEARKAGAVSEDLLRGARCNSIESDPIDQAADASSLVITKGQRSIAHINHLGSIDYRYRYFPDVSVIFSLDLTPTKLSTFSRASPTHTVQIKYLDLHVPLLSKLLKIPIFQAFVGCQTRSRRDLPRKFRKLFPMHRDFNLCNCEKDPAEPPKFHFNIMCRIFQYSNLWPLAKKFCFDKKRFF